MQTIMNQQHIQPEQWHEKQQSLIIQVHQSMAILDRKLTRPYFEAMATVPELVSKETPVLDFLRREGFHPWNAAERLARYWTLRKRYFEDRWLRPMDQTGHGALTPDQVQILRCGFYLCVTPRECPQAYEGLDFGNQTKPLVLIADHSRLPEGVGTFHPQIVLYLFTVTSCPEAQTNNYIVLHHMQPHKRYPTPSVDTNREGVEILNAVAYQPGIVVRAHVVEPGREQLAEFIDFQLRLGNQTTYNFRNQTITGHSLQDTVRQLEQMNLNRTLLPTELGGTVHQGHFHDWVRIRLSKENAMGAGSPKRSLSISSFSVSVGDCDSQDEGQQVNRQVFDDKTDDKKPSPAEMVAVRRHQPLQIFAPSVPPIPQVVVTRGNIQNQNLAFQRDPPTRAIAYASSTMFPAVVATQSVGLPVVQIFAHAEFERTPPTEDPPSPTESSPDAVTRQPGETEKEFKKRRARLYGQRQVQRYSRDVSTLQQEALMLTMKQAELRVEQRRLETLLCQARLISAQAAEASPTSAS